MSGNHSRAIETFEQVTGVPDDVPLSDQTRAKIMNIKKIMQADLSIPIIFERPGTTEQHARVLIMAYKNTSCFEDSRELFKDIWEKQIQDHDGSGTTKARIDKMLYRMTYE